MNEGLPRQRSGESPERVAARPILFVDVDGVISLFDLADSARPRGALHWIDGVEHCIPAELPIRLERLSRRFELVWATGWEHRANERLAPLLGLAELPTLTFDGPAVFGTARWKLDAIGDYAGQRPAAWVDDSLDGECLEWARRRSAPTLVIRAESAVGLTEAHVDELLSWADRFDGRWAGGRGAA